MNICGRFLLTSLAGVHILLLAMLVTLPCLAEVPVKMLDDPDVSKPETPSEPDEEKAHTQLCLTVNLGILPGLKLRAAHIFKNGFLLGADINFTGLHIANLSASAVIGRQFTRIFRGYLTPGLGLLLYPDSAFGASAAPAYEIVAHLGGGIEWRLNAVFALGLEVGVDTNFREKKTYREVTEDGAVHTATRSTTAPFGWLTLVFYLWG